MASSPSTTKPIAGEGMSYRAVPEATTASLERWRNPQLIEHIYSAPKLLNVPRAYEIMDKYGLAGIVASIPHNIQYLSSHSGIMQWMGRHFSTFAFFPRDENAPPALIVPGTMLYHLDYRPTWMTNIKAISAPKKDAAGAAVLNARGDPEAVRKIGIWPVREGAEMERGDLIQLAIFAEFEKATTASALHGLKEAIVEGGGERGRIGFDDPRIAPWLADIGLTDMEGIDASNIFKEIRLIKTEAEIALLREAAVRNESALDYAIEQIAPGLPLEEIEVGACAQMGRAEGPFALADRQRPRAELGDDPRPATS